MRKIILLIFLIFILGCTGRNYEKWEDCFMDCLDRGYDDGNCLTPEAKPIGYEDFGNIGSCHITSGLRSNQCNVENNCHCYCYNLEGKYLPNLISGKLFSWIK